MVGLRKDCDWAEKPGLDQILESATGCHWVPPILILVINNMYLFLLIIANIKLIF